MKAAVTIALVPEIKNGPWVFWNDLQAGMEKAAALGFDAVELFAGSGRAIDVPAVQQLTTRLGITVCAVGTGAGKVVRGLTLTDPDPVIRAGAVQFIEEMMQLGVALGGVPAIIGSMQGNVPVATNRDEALKWLAEGLLILSDKAKAWHVPLIYEPLNRYETNLFNRLGETVDFLEQFKLQHIQLLADLFHMNIEEDHIATSISQYADRIGHVHFADSNRKAIGWGHIAMKEIAAALTASNYKGYLSAEIFPLPDSDAAAKQTIQAYNTWFPQN